MRIGIFVQHYFPYGGLQRDSVRLARAAMAAGHEATLVVSSFQEPPPDDCEVLTLASGGVSNHAKLQRFAKACRKLPQFDTTVAFSRVPGANFHFCGDPCFREKFEQTKPSWARHLPRYQFFLRNESEVFGPSSSTHVFFLAESVLAPFVSSYGMAEDRYTVLPPWLTAPTPVPGARESVCRELEIDVESRILLFVGSDFHRKGLDRAIRALPLLPDTHLVVCGQDSFEASRKLAAKLQVSPRVHLLGPRDDVPRMMSASDILLHPARQETAGMVLIEALSHGLPVLCTALCGYSTHVAQAGCPLLADSATPEEVAGGVRAILADKEALATTMDAWHQDRSKSSAAQTMLDAMESSLR